MNAYKHWFDLASIGGILTVIFDALPHIFAIIAGFLAMVWWALRVYEMKTVQYWIKYRRRK